MATWHFFSWAPGIFIDTWSIDGHPAFLLVGIWHFVCWAPISYSCRHVVFWWPHDILVCTQVFFRWAAGISFPDHVSSSAHVAFLLVATCHLRQATSLYLVYTWLFRGHLASMWAHSVSFGGHVTFSWPPSIFMGTQCIFWCAPSILGATWHLAGHPVFIFLDT